MKPSRHKGFLLSFALLALGCPGRLADPERFVGASPDGASGACSLSPDMVEAQLLRRRCATSECHSRTTRSGGLDLESPDLASRVLNVPSATCSDQTLLDPGGTGFLLDKLGPSPACGDRMPQGAPALSASDVTCLRAWAASLRLDAGAPDVPADDVRPADVPMDVRPTDVTIDARPMDAPVDAPTDVRPMDAPADVRPMDVAADVRPDLIDVPEEPAMDAAVDAAKDAGVDASDTADAEDVSEGGD